MIYSIIYKEFLKSYKIIMIFAVILVWSLFDTFLDVKNSIEYMTATNAILNISQMGRFDYNYIKYICLIFSIALGIAQFYPEVTNARIRLFLHLPMSHLKLISILISIGIIFLILVFSLITLIYYFILTSYYPQDIYQAINSRLVPIFLSSILCYLTTMIVFLEPQVIKKILYAAITFFTLLIYLAYSQSAYFVSYLYNITCLIILIIYIITIFEVFNSYTKGYIK